MPKPSRFLLLPVLLIAACGSSDKSSTAHAASASAPAVPAESLKTAAKDAGVSAFYQNQGWRALWTGDDERALR